MLRSMKNSRHTPRLFLVLALFASVSFLARTSSSAEPDEPRMGSPYALNWKYDVPVYGLAVAATMAGFIGYRAASCDVPCAPPPGLPGIDRGSVGNYSRSAHATANVLVLGLALAPFVLDAADSRFRGWFEDSAVMLEALLVTQGATQVTKSAVRRNAPLVYNAGAAPDDLESADAGRSFFSGHTSTSFAMATAYSVTFWKRHPESPWRFVVLGVSQSLAAAVAMLKVRAGYHYPTDVIAGAVVGTSVGLLVPMVHSEW